MSAVPVSWEPVYLSGERINWLFILQPYGVYWVKRKLAGKWKKASLQTKDPVEAMEAYRVHSLTAGQAISTEYSHYTFLELWADFEAQWEGSARTIDKYRGDFFNHLQRLHPVKVKAATVSDVMMVREDMKTRGKVKGGGKLSKSVLRSATQVTLGSLFTFASGWPYLIRTDNPCHQIAKKQKIKMSEIKRVPDACFASYPQIEAWAAAFDPGRRSRRRGMDLIYDLQMQALVQLSVEIGWRLGEALGARVEDLRLDEGKHGRIHLERQVSTKMKVENGATWYAPLKNADEIGGRARWIALTGYARELLDSYILRGQSEGWLRETGPLFPTVEHTPRTGSSVSAVLKSARERAGIPEAITHHSLRHTYASNLFATGKLSVAQIATQMGNSPDQVEKRYAHLIPNVKLDNDLAEAGRPASEASNVVDLASRRAEGTSRGTSQEVAAR